jgi:hypothetical protein
MILEDYRFRFESGCSPLMLEFLATIADLRVPAVRFQNEGKLKVASAMASHHYPRRKSRFFFYSTAVRWRIERLPTTKLQNIFQIVG